MSQRLSTLDASFLDVESPSAHMHVGWAALFTPSGDRTRPSFEDVRDHIAGRMSRAPRYRQRLAMVPMDVSEPVWVDDERFDVSHHVRRASGGNINDLIDEVMSVPLDRGRPLWEMWVADDLDDGRIGVVGKAHHAMLDGIAAVELASLVLDLTSTPPPSEDDGWRPEPSPGPARLLVDAVADRARRAAGAGTWPLRQVRHPQDLAASIARTTRAVGAALRPAVPDPLLNRPISPGRRVGRLRRPLDDLKRVKRTFDATINDVVLACVAGGMRRFVELHGSEAHTLKAMVPVSMRAQRASAEWGNEISFVFVDLPCEESDPRRRMALVKAQVDARKREGHPEGGDLALRAARYAPRLVQKAFTHVAAAPTTFNLVVSNIPGPRMPMYLLGCELDEAYPVVPLADRHALSVGMTTIREDACFGIYGDRKALPGVDRLGSCIDAALDELLEIADEPAVAGPYGGGSR